MVSGFGLIESLQQKLDEGDYSMDKRTLEDVVKMLRFQEDRIYKLEDLNRSLIAREKSMWNLEETARYLEVSNQTVYNMIRDGRIRAYKIGREWRFQPTDVEAYVMSGSNLREDEE